MKRKRIVIAGILLVVLLGSLWTIQTLYGPSPAEYGLYDAIIRADRYFGGMKTNATGMVVCKGIMAFPDDDPAYLRDLLAGKTPLGINSDLVQTNWPPPPWSLGWTGRFRLWTVSRDHFQSEPSVIPEGRFRRFFAGAHRADGWSQFYRAYPETKGFMTFSRAWFSNDRREAIVYVLWQGHYMGASTGYFLLKKVEDKWIVIANLGTGCA